jgi:hypothetical protein
LEVKIPESRFLQKVWITFQFGIKARVTCHISYVFNFYFKITLGEIRLSEEGCVTDEYRKVGG